MNTKIIDSFAKINLSLDVLEERDDGYHNIDTIMQMIDLKDEIVVKVIEEPICIIECNKTGVPLDEHNLVHKAWEKISEYTGIKKGIFVKIVKKIPVAAGLAGGSSNAASVMKAMNEIFALKLTKEELMEIGVSIGADVPYFFLEKTARATGVGNLFEEIEPLIAEGLLIINNGREISSKEVYDEIRPSLESRIDKVVFAIKEQNLESLKECAYNTMESVVFQKYPEIEDIKDRLYQLGADFVLMSGSGATVFSISKSTSMRDEIFQKIKDDYPIVIKSRTI